MRVAAIVILIVLFTAGSFSLYLRHKTDAVLADATDALSSGPKAAYVKFLPVLSFSNWLTLGKVEQARAIFRENMVASTVESLETDPITRRTFSDAAEAISMLSQMERDDGIDLRRDKLRIFNAIQASQPLVLASGTLSAWNAMSDYFKEARLYEGTDGETVAPFRAWIQSLKDVPRGPMALRDAVNEASDDFRRALGVLGLMPRSGSAIAVAPIPPDLGPQRMIDAEAAFSNALKAIEGFRAEIEQTTKSQVLELLAGKINYNIGALRLQHLLEGGPALRELGSEYVVETEVKAESDRFPTNAEFYEQFKSAVVKEYLAFAIGVFSQDLSASDPSLHAGLLLLAQYHAAWARKLDSDGKPPEPLLHGSLAETARGGRGHVIVDALENPLRTLIIVQVP